MREASKLTVDSIDQTFDTFNRIKVIVIGDLMVDRYIYGLNDRISPEAPVPVIVKEKEEDRLGGAGNVALNLKSLGAEVMLFAVVGKDAAGEKVQHLLNHKGLSKEGIQVLASRPTTVKERVVDQNGQLLRIDHEDVTSIPVEVSDRLFVSVRQAISESHVLIFQDYDKGLIDRTLIERVVSSCKKYSVPVIVDPKDRNFSWYRGVSLFKPNLRELERNLNIKVDVSSTAELLDVFKRLREEMDIEILLLTLSEKGLFIANDKEHWLLPTIAVEQADVSGAGDTVAAVAALTLSAGLSIKEIGTWSNHAARIVCQSAGVVPVDPEALRSQLKSR